MRWLRDRRGYGELRLPYARRRRRRVSWLDRDLRARRRTLLRSRWLELAKILGAFAVATVSMVYTVRHEPLLQAGVVGVFLGAMAVTMVGFLALADGSLLARLGRSIENDLGDELRTTRGVYGVVSGVSFEHVDVDHVVLAPKGCYAIEVKAMLGRPQPLASTFGLDRKLHQTRTGAAKIRHLLRRVDLPVKPVLVLAGPGAPHLNGKVVDIDGVLVAAFRDSDSWRPVMASPGPYGISTAAAAATELLTYCDRRDQHERSAARTYQRPATPPHSGSDCPGTTPRALTRGPSTAAAAAATAPPAVVLRSRSRR